MRPFTNSKCCPKCERNDVIVHFVKHVHEDFGAEFLQHECNSCEYKWNTETAEATKPEAAPIPIIYPETLKGS